MGPNYHTTKDDWLCPLQITAFIDAIEAVGTSVSMKGVLTHALAGWEHLTKELQILRTQMALRHENATMNATEDQSKLDP